MVNTIALVLKTGGVYDHKYINNIAEAAFENSTILDRIVCLTDDVGNAEITTDVELIKLKHEWPKWWSKIELFRSDIFNDDEHVLFLDLDTFIVGNIDHLLTLETDFCALRDFYNYDVMASGVMAWNSNKVNIIYDEFIKNPKHYMEINKVQGDQGFIRAFKPSIEYFQDLFENNVISYKIHCQRKDEIPPGASLVCFHGVPKPNELNVNLKLAEYWKQ